MSDVHKYSLVAASVLGALLLKQYTRGGRYHGAERLDGKTVVVTGAAGGLGKVTARELLRRGAHVIMACRDLGKARAARDDILVETRREQVGKLMVLELDLASFESIRAFCEELNSVSDTVDVLINNAGVLTTTRKETQNNLELTIGVCHFGHFMLTALLLSKLEASVQGRVIFVSSDAHFRSEQVNFDDIMWSMSRYSGVGAYQQAKLANVLCTRELAKRLEETRVTVNCLHPGLVTTDIMRDIAFYHTMLGRLLMVPIKAMLFKSPIDGVQTTLRLALDPKLAKVSGKYFRDCVEIRPSRFSFDDDACRYLVALSEIVTDTKLVIGAENRGLEEKKVVD